MIPKSGTGSAQKVNRRHMSTGWMKKSEVTGGKKVLPGAPLIMMKKD
jgi:hypothetical protein